MRASCGITGRERTKVTIIPGDIIEPRVFRVLGTYIRCSLDLERQEGSLSTEIGVYQFRQWRVWRLRNGDNVVNLGISGRCMREQQSE